MATPQEKAQNLQARAKEKSYNLGIIDKVIDGDTVHFQGQPVNSRLANIDTLETDHGAFGEARADNQATFLSAMEGTPVTREDVYKGGNADTQKLISSLINNYSNATQVGPIDPETVNIRVPYSQGNNGTYKRPITTIPGINDVHGTQFNQAMETTDTGYSDSNAIDALQSSSEKLYASLAGGINSGIQALGEGMQYDEGRVTYNSINQKQVSGKMEDVPFATTFNSIGKWLEEGASSNRDYWADVAKNSDKSTGFVSKNTDGHRKAGKGLQGIVEGAWNLDGGKFSKGVEDFVDGVANTNVIEDLASSAPEMAAAMSNPYAFGALVVAKTEEFTQDYKEKYKELPSNTRKAAIVTSALAYAALNKLGAETMFNAKSLKPLVKLSKPLFDKLPVKEGVKSLVITTANLSSKIGVEMGTEAMQSFVEDVAIELYGDKYKDDIGKIVRDNAEGYYQEAAGAFSMAGTISGVTTAYDVASIQGRKHKKTMEAKAAEVAAKQAEEKLKTQGVEVTENPNSTDTEFSAKTNDVPMPDQPAKENTAEVPTETNDIDTESKDVTIDSILSERLQQKAELEELASDETLDDDIKNDINSQLDIVNKDIKKLGSKVKEAGLVKTLSLDDRTAALNIEVEESIDVNEKSNKKTQSHDTLLVAEDTKLLDIVKNGLNINSLKKALNVKNYSKFTERLMKKFTDAAVSKDMRTVTAKLLKAYKTNNNVKQRLVNLGATDSETAKGKLIKVTSLLTDSILNNEISEANVNKKLGFSPDAVDGTRKSNVVVQLGKDYANSYGLKLKGTEEDINLAYAQIGNEIIELGKELGLIEESTELVPVTKMVNNEGSSINYDTSAPLVDGVDASGKPAKLIKDKVIKFSKEFDKTQLNNYSNVSKLFKSTNVELPSAEPKDFVPSNTSLGYAHKNIIKQYNKLKYKLKPEFVDLIMELKEMANRYESLDQFFALDDNIQHLLRSTDEFKHINLRKSNDDGRNLNRKDVLYKILENIEDLPEEFHYSYESAINQRIHVMETILEYQGDKYFSRNAITGGTYDITTDLDKKVLIENVAEESGLSEEEITNPTGALAKVLEYMQGKALSVSDLVYIDKNVFIDSSMSPFKKLSLLNAIADINKGLEDGVPITTSYMVEYDMSASGVVNTLLNLSGNAKVQKVVKAMLSGVDPYTWLNKTMEEQGSLLYKERAKPIIDRLSAVGFKARDLAKYPIMTWFYGSNNRNVAKNMANDIVVDLIEKAYVTKNQEALDYINEILGTEYTLEITRKDGFDNYENKRPITITEDTTLNNITEKEKSKLVSYFNENLAQAYVENMDKAFPGVSDYRSMMNKIFTLLDKSGVWDGKLGTAMSALLHGDSRKYRMSIRKKKATYTPLSDDEYIPINKMFNNKNSFGVNPQHATDAAQLLLTINHYMRNGNVDGLMTVHDAIFGKSTDMLELKDVYENLLTITAENYDYINEALKELREVIDNTKNKNKKALMEKVYAQFKAINDEAMKNKSEFLANTQTNFFGSKNLRLGKVSKGDVESEIRATGEEELEVKDTTTDELVSEDEVIKKETKAKKKKVSKKKKAKEQLIERLNNLEVSKSMSLLHKKVLDALNGSIEVVDNKFFGGKNFKIYVPSDLSIDPVTKEAMTGDKLVEILAHEIDHALNFSYLTTAEARKSSEYKYLKRVLNTLAHNLDSITDPYVRDRVEYILDPVGMETVNKASEQLGISKEEALELYQISELISVFRNEPKVQEAFTNKDANVIQRFLRKIAEYVKKLTPDAIKVLLSGKVTITKTAIAMESIMNQSAKVKKEVDLVNPSIAKSVPKNNILMASTLLAKQNNYLSNLIIVYGNAAADVLAPIYKTVNKKAMRKSSIYRSTIHALRTGFRDSDLAQKMKEVVTNEYSVDKKLLEDMLQISTAIEEETNKYLTEDMKALDDELKAKYAEQEIVELHYAISKSAIADLDSQSLADLVSGTLDVKARIKELSKDIDSNTLEVIKEISRYYITGKIGKHGYINVEMAGIFDPKLHSLASLMALDTNPNSVKLLNTMDKHTKQTILGLAASIKALHKQLNTQEGALHALDSRYNLDYDGNYMKDEYPYTHEYKIVTKRDMLTDKYSSDKGWKVVKQATTNEFGIVSKEIFDATSVSGIGINKDVHSNGILLSKEDATVLNKYTQNMTQAEKTKFLATKNIISTDRGYKLHLTEKQKQKLEVIQNPAQTLWRTYVHNLELVELQSVRTLVMEKGTKTLNTIEDALVFNKELNTGVNEGSLPMFISLSYDYEAFNKLPKGIRKYYKVASSITRLGNTNKRIQLVKRSTADMLLGHKNFTFFGNTEYPKLAKIEQILKEVIVMAKQHTVVASASKLFVDVVSNVGLLGARDVSIFEMKDSIPKAFKLYNSFSRLRGMIAEQKLKSRLGIKGAEERVKKLEKKLEEHEFYNAYKAGFIQSYSTSLITKDFDSITGLQKHLDEIVDYVTKDEKGNPNDIYKVLDWWRKVGSERGVTLDALLAYAANKTKGTNKHIAQELIEMSERFKTNREADSLARYVNEFVGGPASELVRFGSAIMVTADVVAKYTLAESLLKRTNPDTGNKFTVEEAYANANDTFIDYRKNIPAEIKALSDYGILLFPSFWLKAQRVIYNTMKYHPLTSVGSYVAETVLGVGNVNYFDVNVINKAVDGNIAHGPFDLVDWSTVSPLL